MKKRMKALLVVFTILLSMLRGTTSYAADSAHLIFQGLQVSDVVEIYRICNYDDSSSSYTWASAVTTWMSEKRTGQFYADLSTDAFSKMKASSAREFCELLLDGLKNTSTGVANLQGLSFTYEIGGGNAVTIDPGYYIVLPKGASRVYDLKWFKLTPGEEKTITYTTDDFSVPSITTSLKNDTSDRGLVDEVVPLTELDDQVTVTSIVNMPAYNEMYSDGKRILNVTFVIPYGMEYVADSLSLATVDGEEHTTALPDTAYTVMNYNNVQLYKDYSGNFIFFGLQDYYYEPDGNHLVGPDGTLEQALSTYNTAYGTQYELEESHIETMGGGTSNVSEEPEEEPSEEEPVELSQEGEEENIPEETGEAETEEIEEAETELIGDTSEDKSNLIYKTGGSSIVVISLDTAVEINTLQAAITVKKNQYSTADGWYDIYTQLSYSVSPLDKNLRAKLKEAARAAAWGIRITACMGYADSFQKSSEEILSTAPRMLDDKFGLYKKSNTYSGGIHEAATQVAEENRDKVQLIYNSDLNVTDEYMEYAMLSVNNEGQIAIGGIITGEYLIVQTDHVPGYALSELSFIIEPDDWQSEQYMEGNCVFDLIWLDYKTAYLPATGDSGLETAKTAGILILLLGLAATAEVVRRRKIHYKLAPKRVLQK